MTFNSPTLEKFGHLAVNTHTANGGHKFDHLDVSSKTGPVLNLNNFTLTTKSKK